MGKLNLTKEQVEKLKNLNAYKHSNANKKIIDDWLTLYAEVERLTKVNEVLNSTIQDVY